MVDVIRLERKLTGSFLTVTLHAPLDPRDVDAVMANDLPGWEVIMCFEGGQRTQRR